ncbi:MAG: hypothetical protein U0325_21080 [Polyangiales bacterium]
MKPTLGLAGLNTFRTAIALVAGALSVGITLFGRQVQDGSSLTDCALLSTLWLYVGITAVPWANLRGMAGTGASSALTMGALGAYLAAATAFTGWSTASHPALTEQRPRAPEGRCVTVVAPPPPSARAAPSVARLAPQAAAPSRAATPPPVAPPPPVTPEVGTPAVDAEPRPRRRHHHRSDDASPRAPSVWLERDPAPSGN